MSKRGALTGGYYEPGSSRLEAAKDIRTAESELRDATAALAAREAELAALDARIAALSGELHKGEAGRMHARGAAAAAREELKGVKREQAVQQTEVDGAEREVKRGEVTVGKLRTRVGQLKAELGTRLSSNLSDKERWVLDGLGGGQGVRGQKEGGRGEESIEGGVKRWEGGGRGSRGEGRRSARHLKAEVGTRAPTARPPLNPDPFLPPTHSPQGPDLEHSRPHHQPSHQASATTAAGP